MRRPLLALAVVVVLAGCGGGETVTPTPETVEGTVPQETQATTVEPGDAEAGREVFTTVAEPSCGNCHTYEAAGTEATVGPNLDEALSGATAEHVLESIVNPDAEITSGFAPGVMPKDYGETLSDKQLADLVAFLLPTS